MLRKILLVDDEKRMLDLIELFLLPHGFTCIKETCGIRAIDIVKKEKLSIVILDLMMPGMDGWQVCSEIRQFSDVPVIMLTARSDMLDLVEGLKIGADDYITKPFDERELLARVQALLRRVQEVAKESDKLINGNFILDKAAYSLQYNQLQVQLTLKEFSIIEALISRSKKTFTREELLTNAWEYDTYTDIRTIDSHIRNLREKLKTAGFPIENCLKTVWGIGYKWD